MKNTKGQMHVLEVLLVGVLFTSAVNVAVNILPTSDADNSEQSDLYFSGMEILEILDLNYFFIALSSIISPNGVEVPCALI